MKASVRVPEQILHSGDHYIIPLFQRWYTIEHATIESGSGATLTNWWPREESAIISLAQSSASPTTTNPVWLHSTCFGNAAGNIRYAPKR